MPVFLDAEKGATRSATTCNAVMPFTGCLALDNSFMVIFCIVSGSPEMRLTTTIHGTNTPGSQQCATSCCSITYT
eukprot:4217524-Pyramimonas_sp.AAC.1